MENLLTSTTTKTVRSRQQQCVNRCQLQCGHRYTVNCNGMLLSQINMNQAMNRTYSHVRNGSTAGRSITCKSQKKGQRVDKLYTQYGNQKMKYKVPRERNSSPIKRSSGKIRSAKLAENFKSYSNGKRSAKTETKTSNMLSSLNFKDYSNSISNKYQTNHLSVSTLSPKINKNLNKLLIRTAYIMSHYYHRYQSMQKYNTNIRNRLATALSYINKLYKVISRKYRKHYSGNC